MSPLDDGLFDSDGKPRAREVNRALKALRVADPELAPWLKRAGPFRLELSMLHNPYRALARAVVGQQISGKAATAIFGRVCAHFGGKTFPAPRVLLAETEEALRGCGLSRMKVLSLQDLAQKSLEGTVPTLSALRKLSDDAIVERLTAVRGIGTWTVQMMLMFRLGRADVMPCTDYGVRKGYARVFTRGVLPAPKAVEARGERWRPYRSIASWYLWRVLELP